MKNSTVFVKSLNELIRAIDDVIVETKSHWWFRGHANAEWKLQTKVHRSYNLHPEVERYLTNLFYQESKLRHSTFPSDDDYAGWLALMQHYGLPTRLLDWTESLLTAAYFATKHDIDTGGYKNSQTDAAIWLLNPTRINEYFDFAPVFPSLNAKSINSLIFDSFKKLEGDDLNRLKMSPDVVAAVPTNQDLRMLMQEGKFTLHKTSKPLEEYQDNHGWLRKITIEAQYVSAVKRDLEIIGVKLSTVFPDLDNLAKDIVNRFPIAG